MRLTDSTLVDDSPEDRDPGYLGMHKPADPVIAAAIIEADPDLPDGFTRSQWMWIRLANGDLILGVYPQDDAYFTYEEHYP